MKSFNSPDLGLSFLYPKITGKINNVNECNNQNKTIGSIELATEEANEEKSMERGRNNYPRFFSQTLYSLREKRIDTDIHLVPLNKEIKYVIRVSRHCLCL